MIERLMEKIKGYLLEKQELEIEVTSINNQEKNGEKMEVKINHGIKSEVEKSEQIHEDEDKNPKADKLSSESFFESRKNENGSLDTSKLDGSPGLPIGTKWDSKVEESVSLESHQEIRRESAMQDIVSLFEVIDASGLPNFQGCRIPLSNSNLRMDVWRERLRDYRDKIVCEYLQYGFPLDFDRK